MAITLVPMTCPQCGATIDVPVTQDECFCTYCGTKILIDNENIKTININQTVSETYRKEDVAKLAELQHRKSKLKLSGIIIGAMAIVTALLAVIGNLSGNANLVLAAIVIGAFAGLFAMFFIFSLMDDGDKKN